MKLTANNYYVYSKLGVFQFNFPGGFIELFKNSFTDGTAAIDL